MKILAIDDLQDNLTTLAAIVHDALPACTLLTATGGGRGLELARAEDPDVILLDIIMPEMDGFEVCRRLKADAQLNSIPVIFLTALRTDRESRMQALAAGAELFLSKPIDEMELVAQIRPWPRLKHPTGSRSWKKTSWPRLSLNAPVNWNRNWPGANRRSSRRNNSIRFWPRRSNRPRMGFWWWTPQAK